MSVTVAPLALILPVEQLLRILPGANVLPHPLTTALLVPIIHNACQIYRVIVSNGVTPYNNMNPRGQLERIINTAKHKTVSAKLARIQGAHNNGWEAYSLFTVGVLAAVFAGSDEDDTARLAVVFACLRALYSVIYMSDRLNVVGKGWVRSTVWWCAGICAARLLVLGKDSLLAAAAAGAK